MPRLLRFLLVLLLLAAGCVSPPDDDDTTPVAGDDDTGDDDSGDDDATGDDDTTGDDDATGDDDSGDDDSGDDDDSTPPLPDCPDIDPLAQGIFHREVAVACAGPSPALPQPLGCGPSDLCDSHADCTEGANGACIDGEKGCYCTYDECASDADCGSGICACPGVAPFETGVRSQCLPAACQTDADCGGGLCQLVVGRCGSTLDPAGFFPVRFDCSTPQDLCANHETCYCDGDKELCSPDAAGTWSCGTRNVYTCE